MGLAGRGPSHSQSLRNNPDDWPGSRGFEHWQDNYKNDGTHDQKMKDRCSELRKWQQDVCILDSSTQAKVDAARQWCDTNFPPGPPPAVSGQPGTPTAGAPSSAPPGSSNMDMFPAGYSGGGLFYVLAPEVAVPATATSYLFSH